NANLVFKISSDKSNVICPPEQDFNSKQFIFLLTIGGHLAVDEHEYVSFVNLLQEIGEAEFYVLENIGATVTNRNTPFQATIPIDSSFKDFKRIVEAFEPPFGWFINHFFIFGSKPNWGIYICEYPTINIIGCDPVLRDKFRKVFKITDN